MAPFILAALILLILPLFFADTAAPAPVFRGGREWTGWKSPLALNAEAYREHVEFQQAFSRMPLGAVPSSVGSAPAYLRYSLDEDGLINGAVEDISSIEEELAAEEIPPFPLDGLIDFLTNYNYTDPGSGAPYSGQLLCLVIVLSLCILLILRDRREQRMGGKRAMYMDKRIAA
jgi:hypothetical protein